MSFDYHHIACVYAVRNIRYIRAFKSFSNWQNDSFILKMIELSEIELRFFYKNRHNLQNCKTNGFGKYIIDIEKYRNKSEV